MTSEIKDIIRRLNRLEGCIERISNLIYDGARYLEESQQNNAIEWLQMQSEGIDKERKENKNEK